MSSQAEIERIDGGGDLSIQPPAAWEFDLDLGANPTGVMG